MRIPEQEVTLSDLLAMLRRRWLLVVAVAGGCLAVSLLFFRLVPRRYEATATVRVHSPHANGLNTLLTGVAAPEGGSPDALSADIELQSQAAVLQSNQLALRTIHKLQLQNTPDFRSVANDQVKQLSVFARRLDVKPISGTSMIEIGFRDRDPKIAAAVVNDLVQELGDQALEQQQLSTEAATRTLRRQLEELKQRSEDLQGRVAQMQRTSGIYSVGTTDAAGHPQAYSAVLAQFEHAASVLSSADENRILKQGIAEAARSGNAELLSSLAGNGPASAGGTSALSTLQGLRAQQAALQGQLNQMEVKFGPAYPKVSELAANLNAINSSIHDEVQRIGQRAETDFQVADNTYRNARRDYDLQKAHADTLNNRAIQYEMTRQEADETRGLYEDLLKRLKEAGIFEALRASTIEITDPALVPSEPSQPKAVIFAGGGIAAGLFLGTVLALLLELLGDKVHTADDYRQLGVPIAGVLPGARGLLRRKEPQAAREATLRGLCATILRSVSKVDTGVVLVAEVSGLTATWSLPLALAEGLASQGRRVLLVQADACTPLPEKAATYVAPEPSRPALDRQKQKALPAGESNLSILVSDAKAKEMLDPLDPKQRKALVAEWTQSHDIVIVQAAPILPFSQSQLLAESADVVVLSSVLGRTSKTSVLRAYEAVKAQGARHVLVLAEEGAASGAYESFYGVPLQDARFA